MCSQKTKRILLERVVDEAGYPETLYFAKWFKILGIKKWTLGVMFGSILDPPEPKTLYFTSCLKTL